MSTTKEFVAKIRDAQDYYLSGVAGNLPEVEVKELADLVKKAKADLCDFLVGSVRSCPRCGRKPIGMLQPDGVEIGCPNCLHHKARGHSPAGARASWEEGIDNYNGRPVEDSEGKLSNVPEGWFIPIRRRV